MSKSSTLTSKSSATLAPSAETPGTLAEFAPVPGEWYADLPAAWYHAGPGASNTALKRIALSPYQLLHAEQATSTEAMDLGTLRHTLLLEPSSFETVFAIVPAGTKRDLRTKKYQEFLEANDGRIVVTQTQVDAAAALVKVVGTQPAFRRLLAEAVAVHVETSLYWEDEKTGALCRCRPDLLLDMGPSAPFAYIDLKTGGTVGSAEKDAVRKSIELSRWHVQGSYYVDGIHAVTGRRADALFLVVEARAPYPRSLNFVCSGTGMTRFHRFGRIQYRRDLERLQRCVVTEQWPDYNDDGIATPEPSVWLERELGDLNEEETGE